VWVRYYHLLLLLLLLLLMPSSVYTLLCEAERENYKKNTFSNVN